MILYKIEIIIDNQFHVYIINYIIVFILIFLREINPSRYSCGKLNVILAFLLLL